MQRVCPCMSCVEQQLTTRAAGTRTPIAGSCKGMDEGMGSLSGSPHHPAGRLPVPGLGGHMMICLLPAATAARQAQACHAPSCALCFQNKCSAAARAAWAVMTSAYGCRHGRSEWEATPSRSEREWEMTPRRGGSQTPGTRPHTGSAWEVGHSPALTPIRAGSAAGVFRHAAQALSCALHHALLACFSPWRLLQSPPRACQPEHMNS